MPRVVFRTPQAAADSCSNGFVSLRARRSSLGRRQLQNQHSLARLARSRPSRFSQAATQPGGLTSAGRIADNARGRGSPRPAASCDPAPSVTYGPLTTFRFLLQHPLTKRSPVAAVARYLRWQLGSRILGGSVAVDFVNDARLLVRPGMTGATGNVYAGLHEFEDMAFLLHALRAGDSFVDVGANVGTYTVLAAKVVGARVVAFEPIPATNQALRDNLALNAIESRVELRRSCAGARPGEVVMTTALDTINHVVAGSADGASATMSVPVETLDGVLREAPFLLKLDVEGYEREVLRGAAATLADPRLHCVIMEINAFGARYDRSDSELLSVMAAHGFERCSYAPRERRLELATSPASGGNSLFVRDRALVQDRVANAPAFRVLNQSI
jgi:FkbM family methyltransferase